MSSFCGVIHHLLILNYWSDMTEGLDQMSQLVHEGLNTGITWVTARDSEPGSLQSISSSDLMSPAGEELSAHSGSQG